ncbi:MAG TPA: adenosine deaminase [Gammaproteobacteria bacterium]|jgi:adenosine deaminase|nr:adenosine deaminase [Gammaproteobacteria bacterium]
MKDLIERLPKVELHLHIEGTLEPELMLTLAERNHVPLPYKNLLAVQQAYHFDDLQSFLDLYYLGASVLVTEDDFYLLMRAYLRRASSENIVHAEVMFDPQTHLQRGIGFEVFMPGFVRAIEEAKAQWGLSVYLILCFLRDQSQTAALETLTLAIPFKHQITAVGLDSAEIGHPPSKFKAAFDAARKAGYRLVAHAGEEGGPAMIAEALDVLGVERIDHGVQCVQDAGLRKRLVDDQIPLTVCPLSNVKLRVFDQMAQHPILDLLAEGLCVTVNSDDPAYFGGYLTENFMALEVALGLSEKALRQLLTNGVRSSFLPEAEQARLIDQLW